MKTLSSELGSKRLSLLRDIIVGLKSVAVLASRSDPFTRSGCNEDLPNDYCGQDAHYCAQHPGGEIGPKQVQRR
jgi:hypothetical protein